MPHQFYFCGTQIHPLTEAYKRLKINLALELAILLANYIVEHSDYFLDDGTWNCPKGDGFESAGLDGHTHSRFATIAGITSLANILGRNDYILRMKQAYDWFVSNHGSSFGWSPEFLGRFGDENEGCETCTLMDQINCCIAFANAGYSEYYQAAERICRNQLLENQLLDTHLIRNTINKPNTDLSCFENVAEMVRGGFAGWAGPNDFIGNCDHHYCLMNCCGPAGMRAMHDIWNDIYTVNGKDTYINIYMDRSGEHANIKNYQPYDGIIEITIKKDCNLRLAWRNWFDIDKLKIEHNGKQIKPKLLNGYLTIDDVPADSKFTLSTPLPNIVENSLANGRHYQVEWKGDTVVKIDPPGKFMPFYQNRI